MNSVPVIPPELAALGWRDDAPAAAAIAALPLGRLARVTEQHRTGYKVTDGLRDFPVQSPPGWARRGIAPEDRAAVGDWVWLAPADDTIVQLLPRRSLLRRGAAGEAYKQQLIAANVDTVFVVMGLDGDFNPRRIERYLLLVRAGGAEPVVVLTKADRCDIVQDAIDALDGAREDGFRVVAVNAKDRASVAQLEPWLGPGRSLVLVGSSGAGKSTLTNTLLGREKMKTGEVRTRDSRGRHTTTHRVLLPVPTGACLIDTPGMRELKLTGEEEIQHGGFADVEDLATACRFRNCRHQSEPGCAVQAAIAGGALDADRWGQYVKLQGEIAAAGQSLAAQRARRAEDKVPGRTPGKRPVEKYGQR